MTVVPIYERAVIAANDDAVSPRTFVAGRSATVCVPPAVRRTIALVVTETIVPCSRSGAGDVLF